MAALLADLLGSQDVTFEDLRIPVAVVAADVEKRERVVLDSGPLIPALLATSAFPLLFSPICHQGRWLVDGGALNNLPVDVVRQMGADRVLAVSVPSRFTLPLAEPQEQGEPSPHGLWFLSNQPRDWKLPFRIAGASLGMAAEENNRMRIERYPPDLLLEIELPDVGILTADKNAEVIEAGRDAAQHSLAELVALKRALPRPPRRTALARAARRLRRAWIGLWAPEGDPYENERETNPGATGRMPLPLKSEGRR
jgi:NTE family protein